MKGGEKSKTPRNSKRHKELVFAVTEFVCLDMQTVSVVEGIGFHKLLYTLEPRFQMPSRNHLSRTEIPHMYNQEAKSPKSQLLNPTSFSITTDIWSTSHQNRSYLSLTCHFVSRDFKFNSKCLETVEVLGGHDAESLATVIQEGFDRWQIGERVLFATTDNGGNIKNSCVDHLEILHIPCIRHTLQLGVKKCFDVRRVSTALAHCHKSVGFIHRSYKMTYALREK